MCFVITDYKQKTCTFLQKIVIFPFIFKIPPIVSVTFTLVLNVVNIALKNVCCKYQRLIYKIYYSIAPFSPKMPEALQCNTWIVTIPAYQRTSAHLITFFPPFVCFLLLSLSLSRSSFPLFYSQSSSLPPLSLVYPSQTGFISLFPSHLPLPPVHLYSCGFTSSSLLRRYFKRTTLGTFILLKTLSGFPLTIPQIK